MSRGLCAATVLWITLVVGPGHAEVLNRIVATIDGEPVTAHELQKYAEERGATNAPEKELLDALVTDKLMEKEASAQGIAARKEDIDQYIERIKTRNHVDDEQFARVLAQQGLKLEDYRARVKREIEKAQLVNREIRQRVNVSPEEIDRYYQKHLDDYAVSERITVRDIFFELDGSADPAMVARARTKAEEVLELARDGRKFDKLAEQFSEGAGADKGGLLGTFARGEMEPALEEAAFRLKRGEVSKVIQTHDGFHILRVDEVIEAGHKPLDDVRDEIREALYGQAVQSRFEDWLSRDLRERHHVEVLD